MTRVGKRRHRPLVPWPGPFGGARHDVDHGDYDAEHSRDNNHSGFPECSGIPRSSNPGHDPPVRLARRGHAAVSITGWLPSLGPRCDMCPLAAVAGDTVRT